MTNHRLLRFSRGPSSKSVHPKSIMQMKILKNNMTSTSYVAPPRKRACRCCDMNKIKQSVIGIEDYLLDTTSAPRCNTVSTEDDLLACAASGEFITVTGDISINKPVTFNNDVSFNADVTFYADVSFNKEVNINNGCMCSGNVTINENSTMYIRQNGDVEGGVFIWYVADTQKFLLKGTIDVSGYDLSFLPPAGSGASAPVTLIGPAATTSISSFVIEASGKMLFTSVKHAAPWNSILPGSALSPPPSPFFIGANNIDNKGVIKYLDMSTNLLYLVVDLFYLKDNINSCAKLGSITSDKKFAPSDWANTVHRGLLGGGVGQAALLSYTITDGSGITWDSSNCTPCLAWSPWDYFHSFGCLIDSSHCCTAIDSSSNCVNAEHVCMWDYPSNKPPPDTECWEGRDFSLCDTSS